VLSHQYNIDDKCHYSSRHQHNIYDLYNHYGDVNHIDVLYTYEHDWNFNLNYSHHDNIDLV
jgi:hypothetical protein